MSRQGVWNPCGSMCSAFIYGERLVSSCSYPALSPGDAFNLIEEMYCIKKKLNSKNDRKKFECSECLVRKEKKHMQQYIFFRFAEYLKKNQPKTLYK